MRMRSQRLFWRAKILFNVGSYDPILTRSDHLRSRVLQSNRSTSTLSDVLYISYLGLLVSGSELVRLTS